MLRKQSIAIAILAISFAALSSCGKSTTVQEDLSKNGVIKFGFVGALTGDAAAYGDPSYKGVQMAVEEVNASGGINGKKLEVIYEDGKCTGKDATTAFQKLTQIDGVKVVIGGSCSGETLPMATMAEKGRVILFTPLATNPDITYAGDLVFRNAPSDAMSGFTLAGAAYNVFGYRSVALINENTDYAQGIRRVFSRTFTDLGGKLVADENFNPKVTDFRAQLVKIKSSKPDAILINTQGPQTGSLVAIQARELGINVRILTNEVLGSTDGIKNAGDAVEGMVWAQPALDEESNPTTKKFLETYRSKYNEEPGFPFYAAASYDALKILAKAVFDVGLDVERVRDWLYALKDYDGASGVGTIDKNGDTIRELQLFIAKDGKIQLFKQ